eukprot:GHVR01142949.1.p1 GENE.GHVR01142949.1~~GHVR01142949.1.p1  ORF type:complete len:282 (+),score=47.60 GHVR01142949.1:60-905(+)
MKDEYERACTLRSQTCQNKLIFRSYALQVWNNLRRRNLVQFSEGLNLRTNDARKERATEVLSIISTGWLPHLIVNELTDPTHPVRTASHLLGHTKPVYGLMWRGKKISKTDKWCFLGTYVGLVCETNDPQDSSVGFSGNFDYQVQSCSPEELREFVKDESVIPCDWDDMRGGLYVDGSYYVGKLAFVNDYRTFRMLQHRGQRIPNCEFVEAWVDGWCHIVLRNIPGIVINTGDELVADLGDSWFCRIERQWEEALIERLYRLSAEPSDKQMTLDLFEKYDG